MQEEVTMTRKYEGNGLGLSIVREISKLLGVTVKLESIKGEGTIVNISIPLSTSIV